MAKARGSSELPYNQIHRFFDLSVDLLAIVANGYFVRLNPAWERTLGYSTEELTSRPYSEFIHPDDLHRTSEIRQTITANGGTITNFENRYRCQDGSYRWLQWTAHRFPGESVSFGVARDVTERNQVEQKRLNQELLQADLTKERELIEQRSRFTAMISHEFRTPLTIIASSVDILSNYYDRLTDSQRIERIRGLASHVDSLVRLLDDILALNRIQANKVEFTPEPIDLWEFCQGIVDTIALIDTGNHELLFQWASSLQTMVADRRLLEYVLTNLLTNATKYSPPGSPIRFQVSAGEQSVKFMVQDFGIGIPLADQERLFEPFYRARNTGSVSGTGLGMAIVKSSVDLHNGSIYFESAEGQGTTFWVEIPLSPPPAP